MILMHHYGYRSLGIRKGGKRLDVVSGKGGTLGAKYLDTDWGTPGCVKVGETGAKWDEKSLKSNKNFPFQYKCVETDL